MLNLNIIGRCISEEQYESLRSSQFWNDEFEPESSAFRILGLDRLYS